MVVYDEVALRRVRIPAQSQPRPWPFRKLWHQIAQPVSETLLRVLGHVRVACVVAIAARTRDHSGLGAPVVDFFRRGVAVPVARHLEDVGAERGREHKHALVGVDHDGHAAQRGGFRLGELDEADGLRGRSAGVRDAQQVVRPGAGGKNHERRTLGFAVDGLHARHPRALVREPLDSAAARPRHDRHAGLAAAARELTDARRGVRPAALWVVKRLEALELAGDAGHALAHARGVVVELNGAAEGLVDGDAVTRVLEALVALVEHEEAALVVVVRVLGGPAGDGLARHDAVEAVAVVEANDARDVDAAAVDGGRHEAVEHGDVRVAPARELKGRRQAKDAGADDDDGLRLGGRRAGRHGCCGHDVVRVQLQQSWL